MNQLSRRHLLALGSASAASLAIPSSLGGTAAAQTQAAPPASGVDPAALANSINHGFDFQNFMMDAYATGSTLRLIQSYSDEAVRATGFTYDNAVAIHAYLASGDADSLHRAEILGRGLLLAQNNNFPISDGRFAQAYFVNYVPDNGSKSFISPAGAPFYFYGSAVGDQAWAGMALAQLYARTGNSRYLAGALLVANWIVTNTYDTQGPGGFRFGMVINQYNQSVPSTNGKSTEGNIDTYAFFTMLSKLTQDGNAANGMSWSSLAIHAAQFVLAMFNASGPYFYTGTLGDQVTINTTPLPEDVQTWSYLAGLQDSTKGTIDWALTNLQTTDTASAPHSSLTGDQAVRGLVFSSASLTTTADDPQAVWLEGTAHTAAALVARLLQGESFPALLSDLTTALGLLQQCIVAQTTLGAGKTVGGKAIPTGLGLVAATSVMDTGFGYTYGPSLHIGATGWYLLAALAANPFQLGYRITR